jgi:tRNA (guanine-N7-)-methyltransferase
MTPRELKIEAPEMRLDPDALIQSVDWKEVFGNDAPVEVEIGIGKGRFLTRAAESRPEVSHLGIEWANKYLRYAERRAVKMGLTNVRFGRVDAHLLMPVIPDSSVTAYYVFYPDPWPKKRQMKRRFLQASVAAQLSRTLIPGGLLHVATDHTSYWSAAEPVFDNHPDFERLPEFGGPTFPVPLDKPLTNFEEKYLPEGRPTHRGSWRRVVT